MQIMKRFFMNRKFYSISSITHGSNSGVKLGGLVSNVSLGLFKLSSFFLFVFPVFGGSSLTFGFEG